MSAPAAPLPHVILGAGGHARALMGVLAACGLPVRGCIAPACPAPADWPHADSPWLGDDAALDDLDPAQVLLVNGLGSVGATTLRHKVFAAARARGFDFPALVHPSAIVAAGVTLAKGAQIMAGAIVQPGVALGENVLLNTGCIVDHDGQIGAHSHIAPGVTLSGGVTLGTDVHIGTGATLIQGITVADGAIVGAGAVVTKDVPSAVTVVGNPARRI
ncbi:acetyltransferase [Tropicibacter naphthalenivorans]|uniref:Putative acetyltransferase EpsM n=1 Tax=Tropicibacter naphthalenivorans TaxID=441103 RepID=A0A0P1GK32_9RHOB|nr:acetyltransferase [Tropicibacter naphthalenivorans]CUH82394.1 Putative acetyltransferase EpsM [Tropicibacter naphthalenivorans]SMD05517.1 UDP-perosamine 4-acetyltransferase [Tropicibacter naphthalenivorans]